MAHLRRPLLRFVSSSFIIHTKNIDKYISKFENHTFFKECAVYVIFSRMINRYLFLQFVYKGNAILFFYRRYGSCLQTILHIQSGADITRSIYHFTICSNVMKRKEHKSDIELTKVTPYLALTGELWSVHCEDLGENWPRFNGITLYNMNLLIWWRKVSFDIAV